MGQSSLLLSKGVNSCGYSGQTSTEHMYRNIAIIQGVVTAMTPFKSDTILLVVANPVDLLTSFALDLSGLPSSQVLGSGTFLDSARLRGMLADKAQASAHSFCVPANVANQVLDRGQFNRSLRIRYTWGVAGGCMVDCNYRWRLY
jgi:malate/lactate dehydrogenase